MQREGRVWKKSHNILVGFQPRYLKVIAQGDYLAYYNEKPPSIYSNEDSVKPNGVFEIARITGIRSKKPKE